MQEKRFIFWIVIITGLTLLHLWPGPVYAQEPAPENDSNCVACHEHQYYLYDNGKWFCLCQAPMHCIYCHSGRTDSMVKEVAHEGLVLYPTRNHAERCQACHAEDYLTRAVSFGTIAGINTTALPVVTATPALIENGVISPQPLTINAVSLHLSQLESWQLFGLGVLALVLIAIMILAYRCWRIDCLSRSQS
jgi:hypothetical protein